MKIVINTCHGGFSLSAAAMRRYLELKGEPFWEEVSGMWLDFYRDPPEVYDRRVLSVHDFARHDPLLVQVVEELGAAANGDYAQLEVVEVAGLKYRITEYDGVENVETPETIEWISP